jgi:hypothetical protein
VDCFINDNIFFNADTTHLLPMFQGDIGRPSNKLAAPIDWREREREDFKLLVLYHSDYVYYLISDSRKTAMGYEMNITIDSWEYDRIAWTLKLKRTISHVWCEELKIIIIPVDPLINRKAYVPFWIITNKVQPINCWNRALHETDGFSISQVNLAVLEPTLVDLVWIHPISDVKLMQIWVTMLATTNIPFVIQLIS